MISIGAAIMSLRPNAEWTMENDDVENIVWHTEDVVPLTKEEVEAEINRLESISNNKREAALKKLFELGLTVDDLNALGISGV